MLSHTSTWNLMNRKYIMGICGLQGKAIGVKMRKLFEQRVAGDIALAEPIRNKLENEVFLINNIYMRTK